MHAARACMSARARFRKPWPHVHAAELLQSADVQYSYVPVRKSSKAQSCVHQRISTTCESGTCFEIRECDGGVAVLVAGVGALRQCCAAAMLRHACIKHSSLLRSCFRRRGAQRRGGTQRQRVSCCRDSRGDRGPSRCPTLGAARRCLLSSGLQTCRQQDFVSLSRK